MLTAAHTAAQALARAEAEHKKRSQDWFGWCLVFVRTCAGIPGGIPDAITAWNQAKRRHTNGTPPAGAAVFYTGGKHGHVALSAGGNMVWSTDLMRRGQVDKVSIHAAEAKWGYKLAGWTEDLNGYELQLAAAPPRLSLSEVKWAATHSNLIPGSESRIALIRGSLVFLGCGSRTDNFRDLWRRWQGKCGYRGADADGVPGTASAAALASRCGYVVTP